jgi:ribose transport system permease protein
MDVIDSPEELGHTMVRQTLISNLRASVLARRRVLFAVAVAILIFIVGQVLHPGFASVGSIRAILTVASFIGIASVGQTLVFLVGGIDLSIPWVMSSSAILYIVVSGGHNDRLIYSISLALAMGLVIGSVNGMGVALLGVSPVVITLGVNGIIEGLGLGLTNGFTCSSCAVEAPSAMRSLTTGRVDGIPTELMVWLGVTIVVIFLLSRTSFGRRTYATGNSPMAARLAGVNVKFIIIAAYALSGFFAAIAGVLLVSYDSSISLGLGDPYLLGTIAAVVIGGASITGGRGSYLGTVAGSITLAALVTLLSLENLGNDSQDILYGVAILVIMLLYGRERKVT